MNADRNRCAFALVALGLAAAVVLNLFALAAHALPQASATTPAIGGDLPIAGGGFADLVTQGAAIFGALLVGVAGPFGVIIAILALLGGLGIMFALGVIVELVGTFAADCIRRVRS